jgi:hypothetical protein
MIIYVNLVVYCQFNSTTYMNTCIYNKYIVMYLLRHI